jgi:hypothetical protein
MILICLRSADPGVEDLSPFIKIAVDQIVYIIANRYMYTYKMPNSGAQSMKLATLYLENINTNTGKNGIDIKIFSRNFKSPFTKA